MLKFLVNKITALVLVVILLAHNINTLVIVVDFVANQDFIAKTLCVQKDNQQGCNGKCHLQKQLAKNETGADHKTPLEENKRMVLDAFFISNIDTIDTQNTLQLTSQSKLIYKTPAIYESTIAVDTPPPNIS
ncbi:hypothetical protein [Aestuariibaculum suncheonense]|uniref:Uncharacterized protein n=1 Tax=Aestuariibaculum suncheonense TaxID=1028745 RepID=A0A8J6UCB9_9FLAO|nr:hypothetical protein [Aestuariibaculum suncheonense]MBD0836610.1 hypothetical protein [Aestuariibaculum suncheonense]